MHLRTILSAAAVGALALASASPGIAGVVGRVAPQAPAAQAKPQTPPTQAQPPAAQPPAAEQVPNTSTPFDVGVPRRITVEEVKKRMDAGEKMIILDSRFNVQGPIIKGAVLKTADELETWAKSIPRNTLIVAYCT